MEKVVLNAEKRDVTGKQASVLRREGKLPAVLYGRHVSSTPITLDAHVASRTLASIGSSSLVTIKLDGKEYPALVREKQLNYIRNSLLHVDFLAVSLTEKIRAQVGVELVGLAPAIKEFNAVLVNGLNELEVECLPGDLPEKFVVDLSVLTELSSGVYVRDVTAPDDVTILSDPEEMIVVATAAKEEAIEEEEVEVEAEAEEPEVIERGKREEEEEGEGE
jgi:large subunit ribosomal protein L25